MSSLSEEVARHCQKSRALFSDLVTVPLLPAREGEQVRLADSVATRATLASIAASVERLSSRVARLETLFAGVEMRALAQTAAEARLGGAAGGVGGVNAVVLTDALRPLSEAVAAHQRMLHDLAAVVDVHHHRLTDAAATCPAHTAAAANPTSDGVTSFGDVPAAAGPRASMVTPLNDGTATAADRAASPAVPRPARMDGASAISSVSATTAIFGGGVDRPTGRRSPQGPPHTSTSPQRQTSSHASFAGGGYAADTSAARLHALGALQLDSTVSLLPLGDTTAGSAIMPSAARERAASNHRADAAAKLCETEFSETAVEDASVMEMRQLLHGADIVLLDAGLDATSSDAASRRHPSSSPSAAATATTGGSGTTGSSRGGDGSARPTDSTSTDPLAATVSPRQLASARPAAALHAAPGQRDAGAVTRASSATTTTTTTTTTSGTRAATQSPSLTSPSGSDDPPGSLRRPRVGTGVGTLGGPQAAAEYERAYTSLLRSLRSGHR